MYTTCSKCDTDYAANRPACPKCGLRNPRPIGPRAVALAADTLAADKALEGARFVTLLLGLGAWLWLDAFLTICFRTGVL